MEAGMELTIELTKAVLVEVFVEAYFPAHYPKDCAAKNGMRKQQMKQKKIDLVCTHSLALAVLRQREDVRQSEIEEPETTDAMRGPIWMPAARCVADGYTDGINVSGVMRDVLALNADLLEALEFVKVQIEERGDHCGRMCMSLMEIDVAIKKAEGE